MNIETAQMHTEKGKITEQLNPVVEIVMESSKVEQAPIHKLHEVNNPFSVEGHSQKWRVVL